MKESGWNFQTINSMKVSFYNSGGLNGSSYVKKPLRVSGIWNIENIVKNCFIWSKLAKLNLISESENGHSARVSIF